MATISRSMFRATILSFAVVTICLVGFLFEGRDNRFGIRDGTLPFQMPFTQPAFSGITKSSKDVSQRLDLTERQCRTTFPKLIRDIDESVARGKFVFEKSAEDYKGLVQGRIQDNKLYILTTAPDTTPEILHQRTAILHQLHRALLTSPTTIPNTHFAFVINDNPKNNSWAFSKPNKASTYNTWLMPLFGFWSWASPTIGAMDDILTRTREVEKKISWEEKQDKAIWRGTPWFNPLGHPRLRQELLKVSKNKEWADIQALNISATGHPTNSLPIEDFCMYKYVVYTEGVTYSGRLPYHQACESVLLTPPLTHLTHSSFLLRPISADELMVSFGFSEPRENPPAFNGPPPKVIAPVLPTVEDWRHANTIYVAPDFSNLEATINFLRAHPEVAQQIAANLRHDAAGKGYLGSAAETCYWRALIRGWASVAVAEEKWGEELGERFESWILREVAGRRERDAGVRGKNSDGGG